MKAFGPRWCCFPHFLSGYWCLCFCCHLSFLGVREALQVSQLLCRDELYSFAQYLGVQQHSKLLSDSLRSPGQAIKRLQALAHLPGHAAQVHQEIPTPFFGEDAPFSHAPDSCRGMGLQKPFKTNTLAGPSPDRPCVHPRPLAHLELPAPTSRQPPPYSGAVVRTPVLSQPLPSRLGSP